MTELLNTGNDTDVTPAMLAVVLAAPRWTTDQAIRSCSQADEEIARAVARHPELADVLWHCHRLLVPTDERMTAEFAYRAHCYELLERVADGRDTRPATAAEILTAAGRLFEQLPSSVPVAGLHARWWAWAFPGLPPVDGQQRYEMDAGEAIDALGSQVWTAIGKLTATRRLVPPPACAGRHGPCRYARG